MDELTVETEDAENWSSSNSLFDVMKASGGEYLDSDSLKKSEECHAKAIGEESDDGCAYLIQLKRSEEHQTRSSEEEEKIKNILHIVDESIVEKVNTGKCNPLDEVQASKSAYLDYEC